MLANSLEWWDNEFKENWKVGIDGRLQTSYYCALTFSFLHQEIFKQFLNCNNILDFGCALGQSTNMIYSINKNITGYDFSNEAIKEAKELYPHINFTDKFPNELFDICYISNVLEHFYNPFEILTKITKIINKFIIILVPYEQEPNAFHFHKFYDNYFIANKVNKFSQVYQAIIQTYNMELDGGKQIMYVLEKEV
jgi:2-polyprenyl-3-methyl-5-hydroxy-6-metoxy-1,4-benzoquinol methylase